MKRILLGVFLFSGINMQAGDPNLLPPVLAIVALLQGQARAQVPVQPYEDQRHERAQRQLQRDQQRKQQLRGQRREKYPKPPKPQKRNNCKQPR